MRSVMRACIGSNRAPDGRYAEIDLPASPYRLLNALDEIGIKSTKEIVYQEILNYGSFGYLEPHFDEYTMLEELNALAQKLAVFDRVDSIAFEGLVKMAEQKPEPFGVKELINFAHSTESCHVVSDVFDDEQLGRFYAGKGFMPEYETLPDKIYEHLDFAKIGREARESEGGVFTQRGYRRCTWTSHGQCRIVWRCINRLDYGKKYCLNSITVQENDLHAAIVRALKRFNAENESTYLTLMKATIGDAIGINGGSDEIDLLTRRVETLNKRMMTLVNETIQSGGDMESNEDEFKDISEQIEQLNRRIAAIQDSLANDMSRQERLEQIQKVIEQREQNSDQYDDSIVRQMIECIKVVNSPSSSAVAMKSKNP